MCTVLLAPGGNPTAVNKIYQLYHIISSYTLKILLIFPRPVTDTKRYVIFLFPFYGIRPIVCIQPDSVTNNIKYSIRRNAVALATSHGTNSGCLETSANLTPWTGSGPEREHQASHREIRYEYHATRCTEDKVIGT
jgi:hypothetical protein